MSEANEVRSLVRKLGWLADFEITAIDTSGNNRVFRLDSGGKSFLLKRYFQHPEDPRDRFATERAFYTFLWDAGIRRIPQPFAWDATGRAALFEFVAGKRPETATREMFEQAVAFVIEIDAHRTSSEAASLPVASEACFSLREHLVRVEQRVLRLSGIEAKGEVDVSAVTFVNHDLIPAWEIVQATVTRGCGPALLSSELSPSERRLSPSDFGFHNTIRTSDGNLRFLDFEYAGWDDPAKMVCDFFCQPAVPVPLQWLDDFVCRVATGEHESLHKRIGWLLPVYRIKWCCILLNEFLDSEARRRIFSNPSGDVWTRKKQRLEKAVALLNEVRA